MAQDTITVPCKACGQSFVARKPQLKPDEPQAYFAYTCPHCRNKVKVMLRQRPVVVAGTTPSASASAGDVSGESSASHTMKLPSRAQQLGGRLTWGTFPFRKQYVLQQGDNIVGRTDVTQKSHLMVDDSYMSRRSINIHVSHDENGFKFELRVLHTANPISVADRQLREGDSLFLNFNDVISMGNTKFVFKPVKN